MEQEVAFPWCAKRLRYTFTVLTVNTTSLALLLLFFVIAFPSGRPDSPFVHNQNQKLTDMLLRRPKAWSYIDAVCG